MRREDIEKLLGGYASGTLTAAERKALFEAALDDQALFDSLADEQPLKEVFDDPACRRSLAAALESQPRGLWTWMRRPAVWTLAGSLAGTALIAVVLTRSSVPPPAPPAQLTASAPAPPAAASVNRSGQTQAPKPAARTEKRAAAVRSGGGGGGGDAVGVIGGVPVRQFSVPVPRLAEQEAALAEVPAAPPPPPRAKEAVSGFAAAADQSLSRSVSMHVSGPPLITKVQKRLPSGEYAEITPGSELRAGDAVRLSVRTEAGGYLYVLWRAAPGNWRVLYPAEADGANRVEPHRDVLVPAEGGLRFDGEPGEKQVLLVLATHPEPGFKTEALEPLIERLRGELPKAILREMTLSFR